MEEGMGFLFPPVNLSAIWKENGLTSNFLKPLLVRLPSQAVVPTISSLINWKGQPRGPGGDAVCAHQ